MYIYAVSLVFESSVCHNFITWTVELNIDGIKWLIILSYSLEGFIRNSIIYKIYQCKTTHYTCICTKNIPHIKCTKKLRFV